MSDSELLKKLASLVEPGKSGSDTRSKPINESWRPHSEIDENGGYNFWTNRLNKVSFGYIQDLVNQGDPSIKYTTVMEAWFVIQVVNQVILKTVLTQM